MLAEKVKKHFSAGLFHIFGSSVINKIIAFLSSFILVRILTKAEYGTYTYAWNIYCIVLLFSGLGMDSAVLQLSSEHSGDDGYCRSVSSFGTRTGLAVNAFLGAVILLIGIFAPLKIESARGLLIMLCALPPLQLIFSMTAVNLRSSKKNKEYSRLMIINSLAVLIFSVAGSLLFREAGMVAGQYMAAILSSVLCVFLFKAVWLRPEKKLPPEERSPLIRIALISMLNNSLSQLMYLLDVFVLGIVDPQETILASYKVATVIPTALSFIPSSLVIYIYPYFAQHKDDKKWCLEHYKKLVTAFGAFNLLVSAALFLLAPFIIRTVFGEQYLDCLPVFRLLSINYFFSGTFRTVSGNLLVTQRKLKFNLLTVIITSTCNIVFDYFFIMQWGAVGAAIATIGVVFISSVMSTAYLIYTFRKGPARESNSNE